MSTGSADVRRVAVIGPADVDAGAVTPVTLAGAAAPLSRAARAAHVAVVADARAWPAAALAQRIFRMPWIAWLDGPVPARSRRFLSHARAVVAPEARDGEVREAAPHARVLRPGEPLERVLLDVALAPSARAPGGTRAGAAAGDAWTVLNGRLTRLAIRLVALTGKAPEPTHPRHLIADAPWHHWYLEHVRPGDRLLDVGCSNGVHTVAAAALAAEAVGVDLDARALEDARRRAERAGLRVDFRRADLTEPGALPAARFDAVLLLDVLEHVHERVELLRAIADLLAPRGRLLVAVPSSETPYRRLLRQLGAFSYTDPDHKVEYTLDSLRAELGRAGLRIASLERGGYDSPFGGFSALTGAFSIGLYARLARRRAALAQRHPERATALRVVAVRA